MEALNRLEAGVESLLSRYEKIKSDNEQLAEKLAVLAREKAELEASLQKMRIVLESADTARKDALNIVEALLRNVREHKSSG